MNTDTCWECHSYLGIDQWFVCPECGAPLLKNVADSLFDDLDDIDDDD